VLEQFLHTQWLQLIVVVVAGFLVGLEIKAYRVHHDASKEIGSVRTYTFISLMSYVFAETNITLYIIGYIAILTHFALFYYFKLKSERTGILLFLLTSLVYSFGIIVVKFNIWFLIIVFVAIIFISNINKRLEKFYAHFDEQEIETFAKVLLLSAVILPLLPHTEISKYIPVSFFKVWLAVVVVSLFSYVGYVLKKYFFKETGYLLTGILGGIYSSTATTIVLAKKASNGKNHYLFSASIIVATALMYLRLLGIAYVFNAKIATTLLLPFGVLTLLTFIIALVFYKKSKQTQKTESSEPDTDKNPLELATAFLFAFLFIAMVTITHFVLKDYGNMGLNILSFIVGFTDIDPFVLSILSSKFDVTMAQASTAILIATGSNNILKAFYAYAFSKNTTGIMSGISLIALGALTIAAGFIY